MVSFSLLCTVLWLLLLLIIGSAPTTATQAAFINGWLPELIARPFTSGKPELQDISDSMVGKILDIRLDIGADKKENSRDRMCLQNLVLGLQHKKVDEISSDPKHPQAPVVKMPGFHGPHPQTSGGLGSLDVHQKGHFIDMTGTVQAKFADAANWEVIWRDGAPSGVLLCGLKLEQDAVRNTAKLPKGCLYLSFPVWTKDTLDQYRIYKANCQESAKKHLQDRDEELQKMQNTNNILAKALHYRNAAAAVEKYTLEPIRSMSMVPDEDDVLEVDDGNLFLAKTGTLWSKPTNSGGGGGSIFGANQQRLVGTAIIVQSLDEDSNNDDAKKQNQVKDLAP